MQTHACHASLFGHLSTGVCTRVFAVVPQFLTVTYTIMPSQHVRARTVVMTILENSGAKVLATLMHIALPCPISDLTSTLSLNPVSLERDPHLRHQLGHLDV